MTIMDYKQAKATLAFLMGGVIVVMNVTGLSYINVGQNVYLDLSMIPAAVALTVCGYRTGLLFGLAWGILSYFTHPLSMPNSYVLTLLSQVIFSLCIVYARKYTHRKRMRSNMNYVVMFSLVVHSLIFDVGIFSWLEVHWNHQVPIEQIFVKFVLTMICYYMTLSVVSKQLHQVHILNQVKRSQL
jgi:thiamine transporter ThiT